MSTELPLDLDLEQLRAAHADLGTAILDLAELGVTDASHRLELSDAIFKLSSVRTVIECTVRACEDDEPKEGGNDG